MFLRPLPKGALKRTINETWVRVISVLFIKEIKLLDVETVETAEANLIPCASFNRTFYICEENKKCADVNRSIADCKIYTGINSRNVSTE